MHERAKGPVDRPAAQPGTLGDLDLGGEAVFLPTANHVGEDEEDHPLRQVETRLPVAGPAAVEDQVLAVDRGVDNCFGH
jgi:hypothetical protein